MIDSLIADILAVPALRRALMALTASAFAFPALGTIILSMELIPARFAVMHAALLGAALGLMLGLDPTLAAVAGAGLSSLLVARLSDRGAASAGASLGLVMTLSLALAFLIFYKSGVNAVEAFNLFWGNILTLRRAETWVIVAGSAAAPLLLALFLRPVAATLFDRELAAASGYPARAVHYGLIISVCLGIGFAMRLAGALTADALTLLPALAARNLRKDFARTLLWGAFFGLADNLGGFALALAFDLPTSPAIILVGAGFVFLTGWRERRRG